MVDGQHKADLDRVATQNSVTDIARTVEERPQSGGLLDGLVFNPLRSMVERTSEGKSVRGSLYGPTDDQRTNFERHPLNEMLDLVERTNPEDLESSGSALWAARDAIAAAASELKGHIGSVHWVGESGDAFRSWGADFVTSAQGLSEFAGIAGDQIMAASMGLASVRSSMPPRDTQADRKHPNAFTEAEKVANKDEYATAVRVEKNRQEAINQMNRLSSYYTVSGDRLKALNEAPPKFKSMPNVGVPQPAVMQTYDPGVSSSASSQRTRTTAGGSRHATVQPTSNTGVHDTPTVSKHIVEQVTHSDVPVGTNIDSVSTLPPSTTLPMTGHNAPVTGTPGAGGGLTNAFENGYGTPIPSGLSGGRASGSGGFRAPSSAQGRASTSGLSNSGTGRSAGRGPMNQTDRATETGRPLAKGTASGAKSSPMGRGVTGGTPRAGATSTPRTNGGPTTGAGRANGVVGGRPTTEAGNSAKSGSRLPRGTVIGAEETANSRTATGRPGQRGVFGAPDAAARSGSSPATASRGGTGASEAVTGRPAERNSVARAERNGMTRGGSGLVRGPGSQGKPGDGQHARGASHPDHLFEDEETHLPDK